MILIHSVILCLFFNAGSCQLQCVRETYNDAEFSLNVTTHIKVEFGDCIDILYELAFPRDKVTLPYKKIWYRGDQQNITASVTAVRYGTKDYFTIYDLPRGEYEYGFKLEWGCNQTYVFPKRVRISVSALTRRPEVRLPPLTEGQSATLICHADVLCNLKGPSFHWEWTKSTGGQSMVLQSDIIRQGGDAGYKFTNVLPLTPTADDHNSNITCVADYGYEVIKTTVTLTVTFPPRILNGSRCTVDGKLLVCVCISVGNPLAPITWPLDSLTDFSVTSSSSIQTVSSTITMPAADLQTSVECIGSNNLGQAETELLLQNSTEVLRLNSGLDSNPKSDALLWIITGVSLSVNLVLITALIICTYKRAKSQQKELGEEMNTYSTLNKADVEQHYSVISPQTK